MAKKVHILSEKVNVHRFAIGVSSSISIFQLILELNSLTNLDLRITNPAINPKKAEKYSYPHSSSNPETETLIHIFKNKQNGQILFSGLGSFDYILIFSGEDAEKLFSEIIEKLKLVSNITLTAKLDPKQLKNLKEILLSVE